MHLKTGFNKSCIGAGATLMLSLLTCLAFAEDSEVQEGVAENVAQQETQLNSESETSIAEIVVIAPFPDGPLSLDPSYDDLLKERIRKEVEILMRDSEAEDWRAEIADETDSRIKFGYDARAEYRIRNEVELTPDINEIVKPATVFRIEF